MAKRRSDRRSTSAPAIVDVVRTRVFPRIVLRQPLPELSVVEDRRRFHPEGRLRPALTFSRRDQRRIVEKSHHVQRASGNPFLPVRLAFAVPKRVAVCVRRKQRREVIHAKKLTGRGGGHRRRSAFSDIDCK